jgi:hypothetical protein
MIKPIDYRQKISDGKMLLRSLTLSLSAVVLITVLQDFIHSQLKGYSFYFTESLLFKIFWVLFLPLVFLQFTFLKKAKSETMSLMTLAVLMPTLIHLLSLPLIVWSFSALFYSHTYSYYQILTYTISEDFYKLLLIYGLPVIVARFWFGGKKVGIKEITELPSVSFAEMKPEVKESLKAQPAVLDKIVVSNGRNYIPISVNDILYFGAATPYIEIQLENKRYLHNETLKAINEKLDKKQFVRVHKSTIVNLNKVVSYKSRLNGDYDLLLENKTEIRLSRNYAAEFKELFNRLSTG